MKEGIAGTDSPWRAPAARTTRKSKPLSSAGRPSPGLPAGLGAPEWGGGVGKAGGSFLFLPRLPSPLYPNLAGRAPPLSTSPSCRGGWETPGKCFQGPGSELPYLAAGPCAARSGLPWAPSWGNLTHPERPGKRSELSRAAAVCTGASAPPAPILLGSFENSAPPGGPCALPPVPWWALGPRAPWSGAPLVRCDPGQLRRVSVPLCKRGLFQCL